MTTSMTSDRRQEPSDAEVRNEEWLNSLTHGIGLVLCFVGGAVLIARAMETGQWVRVVGCTIYAASLVAVYAASTLSHFFEQPKLRTLFRVLDQAFIYLLIVGSYTPMALVHLHGGKLWILFIAMWIVAIVGFTSKVLFRHRIEAISTTLYVVLGWMPILGIRSAWEVLPTQAIVLFVGGGLCYTFGLLFLLLDTRMRFFHAAWHLFVIAGSVCHYFVIYWYVVAADGPPLW
ncbi:MAG: hemolysin III family protein [Planctomycetia bacterium]|nr:hemolysin III family protein [Planctomycetia bacterium]